MKMILGILAGLSVIWLLGTRAGLSDTHPAQRDFEETTSIASGPFASAAYCKRTENMTLQFRSGHAYRYCKVPRSCYARFLASAQKGQFYNRHIRGRYPSESLGRLDADGPGR